MSVGEFSWLMINVEPTLGWRGSLVSWFWNVLESRVNKSLSSVLQWFPPLLCLSFCLDLFQWLTVIETCKTIKPLPPEVTFCHGVYHCTRKQSMTACMRRHTVFVFLGLSHLMQYFFQFHSFTWNFHAFIFLYSWVICDNMYHIFLSHSLVDGQWSWFCFLGIANRAAMNMDVQVRQSEDNLSVLPFHYVGPRNKIQVIRLGNKCLYTLSHLPDSVILVWMSRILLYHLGWDSVRSSDLPVSAFT